ncbi:MAG: hypothetical protein KGK01_18295 [Bradyrhizobium sp.]|uniref:hypothetical protein n=1 Tax=Bradyrhizobium sp. TaxID=376 RepID=UPI001C2873EE|nr:hypothetical protein [Bradyrhizobium sp.]MBU6463308.1 hypothetical protein [Pseudomonadota bacterium]MDE2068452.1 hypothetical protein [Bradyrhizobium sp.]MDE2244301.1 hypothetical protein [Bradyrhizobium sp.]
MREASSLLYRAGRAVIAAALLVAACGLGGCAGGGAASNSFAMAGGGGSGNGSTVAFESIDGPPPQVFDRMVGVLDSESKLRNLTIVSRDGQASYRVRSYLAAEVSRGRTAIAWVWDVYDSNQQRALRLSGEEPAGKAGRDAWASADDLVLRRIAQAGFSGLTAMVNGTAPADTPPAAPAPDRRGPAMASADEQAPSAPAAYRVSALSYAAR